MISLLTLLACNPTVRQNTTDTNSETEEITDTETEMLVECPEGLTLSAQTNNGCLTGTELVNSEAFLGIPYAQSPTGERRWQRPQPAGLWPDIFPAEQYMEMCLQPNLEPMGSPFLGSEDCLGLNVFRPKGTQAEAGLPILFYIHGGSYEYGSGEQNEDMTLAENTIVVTHNYRLGNLGFLAHPSLTQEDATLSQTSGTSGNQGIYDTLLALQWTVDNASAFGGDPEQLLIVGESAGGISVCALLASPLAEGLFSAAGIMSAGCLWVNQHLNEDDGFVETAESQGQRFSDTLGCTGDEVELLECMRNADAEVVLSTIPDEMSNFPVIDGLLMEEAPSSAFYFGRFPEVPIFAGVTADEGTLFTHDYGIETREELEQYLETWAQSMNISDTDTLKALYSTEVYSDPQNAFDQFYGDLIFVCPTQFFLDSTSYHTNTHAYYHTHIPSWNDDYPQLNGYGAYHSSELVFLFGSGLEYLTPSERTLSEQIRGTWQNFANGTAEIPGFGEWPVYGANASSLQDGGKWVEWDSTSTQLATGIRQERCDFIRQQWWGQ